jgi:hypothetical protein
MFEGNKLFNRKRAGTSFVRALFRRANLDHHVQPLRDKLKKCYNLGFSRRKNCPGATKYESLALGGHHAGWIVNYGIVQLAQPSIAGGSERGLIMGELAGNARVMSEAGGQDMGLECYLKKFRDGLVMRGEHTKAREVARWIEKCRPELDDSDPVSWNQ